MRARHLFLSFALLLAGGFSSYAQQVDYSVVAVPEETGREFLQVTTPNDYVCMPEVHRTMRGVNWFTNGIVNIHPDGSKIAFVSMRNNLTNIFVKELDRQGSSIQRTNRTAVIDFSFSPDGQYIAFSEQRGKTTQIFQTGASQGYVCRQITNGGNDYSPVYSPDMSQIFFARLERNGTGIWSYSTANNFLSSYSAGLNPCPTPDASVYYCARLTPEGRSEIWKINYATGVEECIVTDPERSFTTPKLSPDGTRLLCVGSSKIEVGNFTYWNTDIYCVRTDGTDLMQLTYHAADDLSPCWSRDGRYIYFISQRGHAEGKANIWRMKYLP